MNTPSPLQPPPSDPPSMLASRKFKAALLAVILIGVLVVGMVVLVAMGKATVDQLTAIWQTAIGSLGVIISVLMGAIAYEDGKAKGVQSLPIATTGDVTVNQAGPRGTS